MIHTLFPSAYMDELLVTLPPLVGHAGQVGVPLLAVLAHHAAVVEGVLPQEALGVVVAVDVDLGQGVVGGRLLAAIVDARFQPGQQELQSARTHTDTHTHTQYSQCINYTSWHTGSGKLA